jgi:hypothetical protein
MAAVDVYLASNICGSVSCYNSEYAPIIAQIPLIADEFGESADGSVCGTADADVFMNWMEQHKFGYLAWTWDT